MSDFDNLPPDYSVGQCVDPTPITPSLSGSGTLGTVDHTYDSAFPDAATGVQNPAFALPGSNGPAAPEGVPVGVSGAVAGAGESVLPGFVDRYFDTAHDGATRVATGLADKIDSGVSGIGNAGRKLWGML